MATFLAEREGFEPSVTCATPLFESGQFNHSCTSPCVPDIDILQEWSDFHYASWGTMNDMKVWRVISLTLWGFILTLMLAISGSYYLLSTTVLDQAKTTAALHKTNFYDVIRDQVLLPKVQEQISPGQTGAVLPQQDIVTEVKDTFTLDKVQVIIDSVMGATYRWADSKTPAIEFSIPIANEKQALTTALEARIRQNVNALPRCDASSEISDNLATATCLPAYITRDAVSAAAITELHDHSQAVGDTLTPEVLSMTNKDLQSSVNAPDYIGYLWAINLVALPLALIITLYLLLKRRGVGLVVVGVSIFMIGLIALSAYVLLHQFSASSFDEALSKEVVKASKFLLEPALMLASAIGLGTGIIAAAGGIFWQRARNKKRGSDILET